MSRSLRAFLWLGERLPLHGDIHVLDFHPPEPHRVGFFTIPTRLGSFVAGVLGLRSDWWVEWSTDTVD